MTLGVQPTYYQHVEGPRWIAHFPNGETVEITQGEAAFPGLLNRVGWHQVEYMSAVGFLCESQPGSLRVLDAACGSGMGSAFLAHHGHQVTGVDGDEGCVRFAANLVPHCSISKQTLPDTRFADGSFGAVVCIETIEHVEDDAGLLAEFARVLEPGGHLVISTPDAATKAAAGRGPNPYHVREYTEHELAELVEAAGYEVVRHLVNPHRLAAYTQMLFVRKL